MEIFKDMYRNELTRTDFQKKDSRVLLEDAKVYCNFLKEVHYIHTQRPEIYDIEGKLITTFNTAKSITLSATVAESHFEDGYGDVIPELLAKQLADAIADIVKQVLNARATDALSTASTDLKERLVGLKNKLGNKEFIILAGMEDYLDILEKYEGEFPYKVYYDPNITDGTLYALPTQDFYVNIIYSEIEMKKDVMSGTYTYVLRVPMLQACARNIFKA